MAIAGYRRAPGDPKHGSPAEGQVTGAGLLGGRWARNAVENIWRALRPAPRALLYPVLGQLLAAATVIALLYALGLPETADGKAWFLVVAYSVVVVVALFGYLIGGSFDHARRRERGMTKIPKGGDR